MLRAILVIVVALALAPRRVVAEEPSPYPWLASYDPAERVAARIPPPAGCERIAAAEGTFGAWLRGLPLRPGRPAVRLFDGREKPRQDVHHAVVDIDVGARDLQQCADAVIRLRAEFLYARGKARDVHFNFTSGDRADFARWAAGERPVVSGHRVRWEKSAAPDDSQRSFRKYLDTVFMYAGTASLNRELEPVRDPKELRIGDVLIQGGSPGHAVLVVDAASAASTGRKAFLLAQSYMPAQDLHILKNPARPELSPWYELDPAATAIETPEWTFKPGDLKRFPGAETE